jgi:hypothetical protein
MVTIYARRFIMTEQHECEHEPTGGWMTTREAADRLGYSDGSVFRHAIKRQDLKEGCDAVKRGGVWFIREDAALDYHARMLEEFAQRRPPYQGPVPDDDQS